MDMNGWISHINYASAFKSAGVRMRPLSMSQRDIELTGVAAATTHLQDIQSEERPTLSSTRVQTWYGEMTSHSPNKKPSTATGSNVESTASTSRLYKATFDQVKEEIAAGRWHNTRLDDAHIPPRIRAQSLESTPHSLHSPPLSPLSDFSETSRRLSRSEIVRAKLLDLEAKISRSQTQLEGELRLVRNLAVLAPFQQTTRDRVLYAVQLAAKRIMTVRLELEKVRCHRDVLADDLTAEERNWQWARKTAMRAATARLESQHMQSSPATTVSMYLDEADHALVSSASSSIALPEHGAGGGNEQEPSFGESFFSTLDSPEFWDETVRRDTMESAGVGVRAVSESPLGSPADGGSSGRVSGSSYPFYDRPEDARADSMVDSYVSELGEEQAEEWNKTRAAKRVSLVRVPADLRIAVLFGKQSARRGAPDAERDDMFRMLDI